MTEPEDLARVMRRRSGREEAYRVADAVRAARLRQRVVDLGLVAVLLALVGVACWVTGQWL